MNALAVIGDAEHQETIRLVDVAQAGLQACRETDQAAGVFFRKAELSADACAAVWRLRDEKRYLRSHRNWKDFCREVLEIDRATADRYVMFAKVRKKLAPIGAANEYMARQFANLPAEEQEEAREEATEGGQVMAEKLRAALKKRRKEKELEDIRQQEDAALRKRSGSSSGGKRRRGPVERLEAIRRHLRTALELVDGSIDHAERLAGAIQVAIEVGESCAAA